MALSHRLQHLAQSTPSPAADLVPGKKPRNDGSEPMDTTDSAEDQVIRDEDTKLLYASLQTLAEDHRQILVLREIDGRSYEEIAEICELPVGTVRSRLHRARKQLLESMKQRHPEMFTTP